MSTPRAHARQRPARVLSSLGPAAHLAHPAGPRQHVPALGLSVPNSLSLLQMCLPVPRRSRHEEGPPMSVMWSWAGPLWPRWTPSACGAACVPTLPTQGTPKG